jgi:hypothetical protein
VGLVASNLAQCCWDACINFVLAITDDAVAASRRALPGVILQTPSGAVLASLIANPGDAIIVIPTGRQTPLDGVDDGPQVSNHHCHTARTSTVLPGQRRKNRQAAAGRTVRRPSLRRQ